jgi:drug/metabolite transporter (DMT)-like permease
MRKATKADLYLLLVTLIWGGTFPIIRNTLHEVDPIVFITLRFFLAALIFLPFVISRLKFTNKKIIITGIMLGILTSLSYYPQTIGLKTLHSSESAFITSLSVVIIPILLPYFKLGKPKKVEIIAALLCLYGVYVLSGANFSDLMSSEYLWTFFSAFASAFTIVYLQKTSANIQDTKLLAFYQILFATVTLACISIVTPHSDVITWNWTFVKGLLYCGILSTCLTLYLQTRYQKFTTATKTGIIFTMEPVFATIFAFYFNGEMITRAIIIGGVIIVVSLLLSELSFKKVNTK